MTMQTIGRPTRAEAIVESAPRTLTGGRGLLQSSR